MYAQINGDSIYLATILLIQFTPIYALLGPTLYFYIHFFFYKKYRFTYVDLIHLIPAIFLLANELPYLFMSFSEKIMVTKLVHQKLSHLFTIQLAYINVKMTIIFRLSISLLYLVHGYFLFFKFRKSLPFNLMTTLERKRNVSWMFLFLFSSTVMFGGMMFAMASTVKLTYYFYLSISGLGMLFLITSLIFYPTILYGTVFSIEPLEDLENSIKLPKNRLLSQKQLIHIDTLVAEFMIELPYIRNDFNLNKVSL